MEVRDVDEVEREELHAAIGERYDALEKLRDTLTKRGLHAAAQNVGARLSVYEGGGGLKTLFASQAEIEHAIRNERERSGESAAGRDDGTADMFRQDQYGGGSEVGAGIPAGRTESVDWSGRYPQDAEAEAAQAEMDAGAAGVPADTRLLTAGDAQPDEADYEIVHEVPTDAPDEAPAGMAPPDTGPGPDDWTATPGELRTDAGDNTEGEPATAPAADAAGEPAAEPPSAPATAPKRPRLPRGRTKG